MWAPAQTFFGLMGKEFVTSPRNISTGGYSKCNIQIKCEYGVSDTTTVTTGIDCAAQKIN